MTKEADIDGLGVRIRDRMKSENLTLEAFSKKTGISVSYLSQITSETTLRRNKGERRNPSIGVVYQIGQAFGVTVSELIGETTSQEEQLETLIRLRGEIKGLIGDTKVLEQKFGKDADHKKLS